MVQIISHFVYCNCNQATLLVPPQTHFTSGAVVFVNPHSLTDETTPSTSHQYYNMTGKTEPVEESGDYVYMDPPTPPQGKKQPLHPGRPLQPLTALSQFPKSGAANLGKSPVMQAGKQHSDHSTSSGWQKHSSMQGRGIDG